MDSGPIRSTGNLFIGGFAALIAFAKTSLKEAIFI